MKRIYTTGDSHCWHGWLKVPGVITQTRGPMTMFSFGLNKSIVTEDIPDDSFVIFCWGEVDCRCHVNKYPPAHECIDNLVAEYIKSIKMNVKGRKLYPFVYLVVPPVRKASTPENPGFPFLGTDDERREYVLRMNSQLKKQTIEAGIGIVDVYDQYCDEDGFLDMKKSDGHVHISDEKPLINFVKNGMVHA